MPTPALRAAMVLCLMAALGACSVFGGKAAPEPAYDVIRSDGDFEAWLCTIARNQAISLLRKESRLQRQSGFELEALMADWRRKETTGEHVNFDAEIHSTLSECLTKLAENHRDLVEAFYFEGESAEALAERQDVTAASIRMMLMRIRRALGKCIRKSLPGVDDG